MRQHTLVRRQWRMIALGDLRALATLLQQLEGWLEEVHEKTHVAIKATELSRRSDPGIALVPDHPAHDGAVLLFDMSLVILPVRPTSGESHLLPKAPGLDRLVHEDGIVVRIE